MLWPPLLGCTFPITRSTHTTASPFALQPPAATVCSAVTTSYAHSSCTSPLPRNLLQPAGGSVCPTGSLLCSQTQRASPHGTSWYMMPALVASWPTRLSQMALSLHFWAGSGHSQLVSASLRPAALTGCRSHGGTRHASQLGWQGRLRGNGGVPAAFWLTWLFTSKPATILPTQYGPHVQPTGKTFPQP